MFLLCIFIIFLTLIPTEGCFTQCPQFRTPKFGNRLEVMFHLSDSLKLQDLALVGTRYSASYNTDISRWRTQNLSISKQLSYGVRVLHGGLRATSDKFAMHKDSKFLNLMFGEVLTEVNKFLTHNPKEFVIFLIKHEHYPASDVTKSDCEILNYYRWTQSGERIVIDWSLDDPIKKHRGKILIAGLDRLFSNCTLDVSANCKVQNKKTSIESSSPIEDKWIDIKNLQEMSFWNDSGKCFFNFLADPRDHNTARMAIRGYSSSRNGCEAPINFRMAEHFNNPHRALVIIMADYVTQNLIDGVINTNYKNHLFYFHFFDDFERVM